MNISIRPFKKGDEISLVKYANNKKIADNLTNAFPHPYTAEHAKSFVVMAISKTGQIFAITKNDELIGAIGLHPQTDIHIKNAELGYWLAEPFWGQKIMSEIIPQIVKIGFENFDINRIFARPYGRNIASQKVLEKAGFKLEARLEKTIFKNNQFEDELIYAIRK